MTTDSMRVRAGARRLAALLLTIGGPTRAFAMGPVPASAPSRVVGTERAEGTVPPAAIGPAAPRPPAIVPVPPLPAAAPNTLQPPQPDAALRRVLASGCHDGLDRVYALASDARAPWAATVLRLCGEILLEAPPTRRRSAGTASSDDDDALAVTTVARPHPPVEQDGRGRLVVWSSLYGIWLGAATDVLFEINGTRPVMLAPLLGMGAGLTLSLQLTKNVRLTAGQAWTVITGIDYGSINGALWAGAFDAGSKGVVGTAVASGFAATAAGLAVADAATPSAGDIELVRSGLLWGATGGFLAVAAVSSDSSLDEHTALAGAAVAMDLGFLAGLSLARHLELSRNRVLMIDAGALGGAVTGLGIGWLAVGNIGQSRRTITGLALAGLLGGIAIAAYNTRDTDKDGDEMAMTGSPVPALWARGTDGAWGPGAPAPTPVLDGAGHRLVGATLNAVGGVF